MGAPEKVVLFSAHWVMFKLFKNCLQLARDSILWCLHQRQCCHILRSTSILSVVSVSCQKVSLSQRQQLADLPHCVLSCWNESQPAVSCLSSWCILYVVQVCHWISFLFHQCTPNPCIGAFCRLVYREPQYSGSPMVMWCSRSGQFSHIYGLSASHPVSIRIERRKRRRLCVCTRCTRFSSVLMSF